MSKRRYNFYPGSDLSPPRVFSLTSGPLYSKAKYISFQEAQQQLLRELLKQQRMIEASIKFVQKLGPSDVIEMTEKEDPLASPYTEAELLLVAENYRHLGREAFTDGKFSSRRDRMNTGEIS